MSSETSNCPCCGHEVLHAQEKTVYSRFVVVKGRLVFTGADGEMDDGTYRIVCMNCTSTWDCLEDYLSALEPRIPTVVYDADKEHQ